MNPVSLTLVQARAALRSGAMGCVEYVQALLAQCEAGASLNAWVSQDPDALLRAAAAMDHSRAARDDAKPLAGLPLAIKDMIDTVALPTSGGTRALLGRTPKADAPRGRGRL